MASIYELTGAYKALETEIELNPEAEELQELLDQINDAIEVKAENYGKIIKNLSADITALDDEITRLTNKKNSLKNSVDRLKSNLMDSMKKTNKLKFKTKLFSFSVAKNGGKEPLVIDVEPDKMPDELVKITREADKEKIREYIEETGDMTYGHFVPRGEHLLLR